MVAVLEPVLDRSQHADDVLLRHLHRAAQRLMRRCVGPRCLHQLLRAEQESAGLGAAQELAAAIDDEVGAADEPRARPFEMLGSGIDHDWDAARLDHCGDLFEPQAAQMLLLAEHHDHRHWLDERLVEISSRLDLDKMAADHPHRLVIGETLRLGDQDTVDHPVGEGQAQHFDRIVAGDAGRRRQGKGRSTPSGDHGCLAAQELRDALSHRLLQVLDPDILARRDLHGGLYFRGHQ